MAHRLGRIYFILRHNRFIVLCFVASLFLHIFIFVFIFGGFEFWRDSSHVKEVAIRAVFLPDTQPDEVKRIAKRDPIPPPPPPPPPPPIEVAKPEPKPQVEPTPPPPKEEPQQGEAVPPPPPTPPVDKVDNAEDFSKSILKTLEKVQAQPPQGEDEVNTAPRQAVSEENLRPQESSADSALTLAEIENLRLLLAQCWSVSVGSGEVSNLRVAVRLRMDRDGRILSSEIVDKSRFANDVAFRVMAEDVLRALHHPKCIRLPLPLDRYKSWQDLILEFDPQEMLG